MGRVESSWNLFSQAHKLSDSIHLLTYYRVLANYLVLFALSLQDCVEKFDRFHPFVKWD